jgi:heme exporter protein D
VVVLYVWLAVGGVALVVLAILGYGLFSQFTRLRRTVAAVQGELAPMIATLQPDTPQGRHRAG